MDKTEYRIKLDEINRLVEAQDYENALEIVDSIEWKRVKSVRTLCMVADIYEVNGELEESMRLLQLAYKRSSLGKMILYRQVELALKMGRANDAVKYYNKYLETASNDTSKYVLKYKICKAQNAPLEEQIAVLEEYKNREYTERWVYELAKLYKRADKKNKCIEICDDLILWFGEGKYVLKAMELKKTYEPLTSAQQQKYDKIKKEQKEVKKVEVKPATKVTADTVAGISAAAMEKLQKASVISEEESKQEEKTTELDEVAATSEEYKPVEETKVPEPFDTAKLQEKLAKSFQEVLSGINRKTIGNAFENLGKSIGIPMPQESVEENIEDYQVEDLEPEAVNEAKITAEKGEAIVHRVEDVEEPVEKEEKPEPVENKEIVSLEEMDLEALFAETSKELAKMAEVAKQVHGEAEKTEVDEKKEVNEQMDEIAQEQPKEELVEEDPTDAAMAAFEESVVLEMGEIAKKEPDQSIDAEPQEIVVEKEDTEEKNEPEAMETVEEISEPEEETVEEFEIIAETDTEVEVTEENPAEGIQEEDFLPEIDLSIIEEIQKEKAAEEETVEEISEPEEIEESEMIAEMDTEVEVTEENPEEDFLPEIDLSIIEEIQKEKAAEEEETVEETSELEEVEESEMIAETDTEVEVTKENSEEMQEEDFLPEIDLSIVEEIQNEKAADEIADSIEEKLEQAVLENAQESVKEDVAFADLETQLLSAIGVEIPEEISDETAEEIMLEEPVEESEQEELNETENENESTDTPLEEEFLPEIDMSLVMEIQKEKDGVEENIPEESVQEEPEMDLVEKLMAEVEPTAPEILRERETPEEKRYRILNATRPEKLSEEQKRMFTYFSKVPGMDDQILEAIKNVYDHADEKTSRRGNIAIMGGHGTGKTQLTENLVKAICKELGLDAIKFANLDASDMNQKDPATVIGKMAGGFLLIQRASHMTKETVEKLSQAMDFRTDSMILFIEDDKVNMRRMLALYPEFAKKFDTVISIPVFTNDELVTFARTYAKENGYRIDEMGILALYTLIGDNQREDEPITVGRVKDMVDGAIHRSGVRRLGIKISRRHTDENGRILLREKDFDL